MKYQFIYVGLKTSLTSLHEESKPWGLWTRKKTRCEPTGRSEQFYLYCLMPSLRLQLKCCTPTHNQATQRSSASQPEGTDHPAEDVGF